jgi:hypothetical protein
MGRHCVFDKFDKINRFVGWSSDPKERHENDLEINEAAKYLTTVYVEEVASKLDASAQLASSQDELVALAHYWGINIRYLGLLR